MKRAEISILMLIVMSSVLSFASAAFATPTLVWSVDTGANPASVATDASGNVYVVNYTANSLQKFDPAGALVWTTNTAAKPSKVLVNSLGYVLVLSTTSKTFQVFEPTAGMLKYTNTSASLTPVDFAVDGSTYVHICYLYTSTTSKDVYINRYNFVVSSGNVSLPAVWTYGPRGSESDYAAIGITPATGTTYLNTSTSYTRIGHEFYQNRLTQISSSKVEAASTAGYSSGVTGASIPKAVAVAPNLGIFVLFNHPGTLQKWTNGAIKNWGIAVSDTSCNIAPDTLGNVYVVDEAANNIQKYTSTGDLDYNFYVTSPKAIALDSNGSLFIVRYDNNKLEKYTP